MAAEWTEEVMNPVCPYLMSVYYFSSYTDNISYSHAVYYNKNKATVSGWKFCEKYEAQMAIL